MPHPTKPTVTTPNPLILKGLAKRSFLTANELPVYGGYYSHIDTHSSKGKPPKWKNLKNNESTPTQYGRFYTSLKLRYLFRALNQLKSRKEKFVICAATINLNKSSCKLIRSRIEGPAGAYGKRLNRRFATMPEQRRPFFIAVIEEAGGSLHAHITIALHISDVKAVRSKLRIDSRNGSDSSDVQMKLKYKRYSTAKSKTDRELEELDREYELSNFPNEGFRRSQITHYKTLPIDAGWMDYLSKDIERESLLIGNHKHFYSPHEVSSLASKLYEDARTEYLRIQKL